MEHIQQLIGKSLHKISYLCHFIIMISLNNTLSYIKETMDL